MAAPVGNVGEGGGDPPRAIFDREAFERQTGGDAALRDEIIGMFLEDCPLRLDAIRAAVRDGDAQALVSCAHALKGSASYLAASVVRGLTADLERAGRDGRLADAPAMLDRLAEAVATLLQTLREALDR